MLDNFDDVDLFHDGTGQIVFVYERWLSLVDH